MLALKDAFEVLLIEVDASELVDDLVYCLDQLYSVLEVVGFVYLLREKTDNEIGVGACQRNHEVDRRFGVEVIQHKNDVNDLLGLLMILRCDLDKGIISHHHQRDELKDLKSQWSQ